MMTASEILRRARKLIEREEAWTSGAFARDAIGDSLPRERRHEGIAYCQLGAVFAVRGGPRVEQALDILRKVEGTGNLASWNDAPDRTHAQVLAAFDVAIARAEAEESASA